MTIITHCQKIPEKKKNAPNKELTLHPEGVSYPCDGLGLLIGGDVHHQGKILDQSTRFALRCIYKTKRAS